MTLARAAIGDSLLNVVTGIGTAKDPRTSTRYHLTLLEKNVLEHMYRGDWMARRFVDLPAHDASREWRTWQMDGKKAQKVKDLENKFFVQRKFYQALVRSRLYGGGALVIGVDQGDPSEELDLDKVGKDDLKFVVVVNRYELAAGPRIYDVESPYYTRPEYYTVSTPLYGFMGETGGKGGTWPTGNQPSFGNYTSLELPRRPQGQAPPSQLGGDRARQMYSPALIRIHPSRIIEFNGNELPDWRLAPMGGLWGDSVLQTAEDALKDFGMSISGLSAMINDMKMDVVKIPDMSDRIVTEEYRTNLITRFTVANTAKSVINSILLDKDEEWERIQTSFGGTADLLRVLMTVTCAAVGVPESRLMGSAPSKGLAASGASGGEVDVRNYFDDIMSEQRTTYQPALYTLDRCLVQSALGGWDDGDVYTWNPLYKPDPAQVATVALQNAQATAAIMQTGLINEDALRDGVVSQLVEAKTYPSLEDAIEKYGAKPEVEEPPPGMMEPGKWAPNPLVQQKLQQAHQKAMAPLQNKHQQAMARIASKNPQAVNSLQTAQANQPAGGTPPPGGGSAPPSGSQNPKPVGKKVKDADADEARDVILSWLNGPPVGDPGEGTTDFMQISADNLVDKLQEAGLIDDLLSVSPEAAEQWLTHLYDIDGSIVREALGDFNPNHDPKTGRFTTAKATGASRTPKSTASTQRRSASAKAAHARRAAHAAEPFPLAEHASPHQVGMTAVARVIAAKRGNVSKGEMAKAAKEDIKTAVASWAATQHLKTPITPEGVDPAEMKTAYKISSTVKQFFQDPGSSTILSQATTKNTVSWLRKSAATLPGHALEVAHKALVDRIVDYTAEALTDVVIAGIAGAATVVGGLAGAGAAAAVAPLLHVEVEKGIEHVAERIGFTPERIKEALHGVGHVLVEHYRKWKHTLAHDLLGDVRHLGFDAEPDYDLVEAALQAFAEKVD
jgi:hypothetical protein